MGGDAEEACSWRIGRATAFRLPTWDHEKGLQTNETPKPGLSPQHFSHHIACKPRRDGLCAACGMRRGTSGLVSARPIVTSKTYSSESEFVTSTCSAVIFVPGG